MIVRCTFNELRTKISIKLVLQTFPEIYNGNLINYPGKKKKETKI